MTSTEIQKKIEEVELLTDRNRDELKFQKQQTLATLEVALQLAQINERASLDAQRKIAAGKYGQSDG